MTKLITLLLKTTLTLFSCIILSYISMSISIGPWISPVIILICNFLLFKLGRNKSISQKDASISLYLLQVAPSLAGLICTAIGFMLPTLYFLDRELFLEYVQNIGFFYPFIFGLTLVSAIWGALLANGFYDQLHKDPTLCFSVPTLIANITKEVGSSVQIVFVKGSSLAIGLLGLRGALVSYNFLPSAVTFYPSMIAVGFSAGKKVLIPFCLGFALKYKILPTVGSLIGYTCLNQSSSDFTFAVATGIIIFDLFITLLFTLRKYLIKIYNFIKNKDILEIPKLHMRDIAIISILLFGCILFILGRLVGFPSVAALYAIVASVFILLEIMKFAAAIGLVPFGRFATILMIPALMFFSLSHQMLVLICFFISVASATAVSFIFNRKTGELLEVPAKTVDQEFWKAIILTSVLSTGVFLFLFNKMQPGTALLFAQRGQSRALLIKAFGLSYGPLLIGGICLIIIKSLAISETMVFSALLMPPQLSISMLAGSLLNFITKKNTASDFFFSGIFAGESIFVIISLLF